MLFLLDPAADHAFPDPALAETEPNGLLAVGGDLSPRRLVNAYREGIFPWYSTGQPILWWSPDPRLVLRPQAFHLSRSLRKTLRSDRFQVSLDADFGAVIRGCAAPRPGADDTWIVPEMITAYERLHALGLAHAAEAWRDGELAGGLYGVALGRAFFGESMFSQATDASKVAFAHLARRLAAWGYALIDCQVHTPHLASLGAVTMPRALFLAEVAAAVRAPPAAAAWDPIERLPARTRPLATGEAG
jgi:leucyl/phenylalanyl-tRNA--protein transferase